MKTTIVRFTVLTMLAAVMSLTWLTSASGGNIDLVTLPSRDEVQLTIYNSEDLTLIRERRFVTVKHGDNRLQFSWANTLIDPSSVEFRPLEHKEEVILVDTVFSGTKAQSLIWNIDSKFEGQLKVEVSYFTSGITWRMDYVGITNPDETQLDFKGYVSVLNNSGENYEYAEIRLIVGKINLVERIADLAKRRGIEMPKEGGEDWDELRKNATKDAFDDADIAPMANAGMPMAPSGGGKPKKVVKEGVSEYFMFSVEGRETVPHGWSKRMIAVNAPGVPFEIVYRMRDFQYGPRPVRFFIWNNDDEHKLGESPIPDGLVNLLRENGREGLAFLGRQTVNYVPIKGDIEINLGPDDLVTYEALVSGTKRTDFSFNRSGWNEYVDGWQEGRALSHVISNYRAKPIKFELRRIFDGDVDYSSDIKGTLFDYRTVETVFVVEPRAKKSLAASLLYRMGSLSKQNRIVLK